jgi:hypothetical protein
MKRRNEITKEIEEKKRKKKKLSQHNENSNQNFDLSFLWEFGIFSNIMKSY